MNEIKLFLIASLILHGTSLLIGSAGNQNGIFCGVADGKIKIVPFHGRSADKKREPLFKDDIDLSGVAKKSDKFQDALAYLLGERDDLGSFEGVIVKRYADNEKVKAERIMKQNEQARFAEIMEYYQDLYDAKEFHSIPFDVFTVLRGSDRSKVAK